MYTFNILLVICSLVVVQGCSEIDSDHPSERKDQSQRISSFEEVLMREITPTANGGAYITGAGSSIWYAKGAKVVRVTFSGTDAEPDWFSPEVTPMIDGTAYAASMFDGSIWHLDGSQANKVVQTRSLPDGYEVQPVPGFALFMNEREKRLELQEMLEHERYGSE